MWDLPRPGIKPVSNNIAGRFSSTAPPRSPKYTLFNIYCWFIHIQHTANRTHTWMKWRVFFPNIIPAFILLGTPDSMWALPLRAFSTAGSSMRSIEVGKLWHWKGMKRVLVYSLEQEGRASPCPTSDGILHQVIQICRPSVCVLELIWVLQVNCNKLENSQTLWLMRIDYLYLHVIIVEPEKTL